MKSGVYVIRSKIDSRTYVGSTVNIRKRIHGHKSDLRQDKHGNPRLQNFVNKYGLQSLSFAVLERCHADKLIEREQHYMDTMHPAFNICPKAGTILGVKRSRKFIEAMRMRMKGTKPSAKMLEAARKKNTGRQLSYEHKRSIGLGNKGKAKPFLAERNRARIGIPLTEEHRHKLSVAGKGQKRPHLREYNRQRRIESKNKLAELVGEKWGRLIVERPEFCNGKTVLVCRCHCGNTCRVAVSRFLHRGQRTCGCRIRK